MPFCFKLGHSASETSPANMSTVYGLTIIFVLTDLLPGPVDLHCVVQVPELMRIDINLPFLWNTNIVNSTSCGAFKSKLNFFSLLMEY